MAPISAPTCPPRTRLQRGPAREDRGHLDAELSQRGRHLAADESHADDDRAPASRRLLLDRVALGHRAQVVDPGQAGPGNREPPVPPSGGDQDLLVGEFLARVQGHRVRGGIDGHHAGAAAELDIVAGVPVGRPDVPAVEILLGPQVGLGQRRTAEGDARFPADEHDRPGKPSSRSVAAALPPARPPPTITIGFPLVRSAMQYILVATAIGGTVGRHQWPFGMGIVFTPATVCRQRCGAVLDVVLEQVAFANPETGHARRARYWLHG